MTDTSTLLWLNELVGLLGRLGELDAADEQALDELLESGLNVAFDDDALVGLDPALLDAAIGMLSAARSVAEAELAAVHRQRIDVDRTVRAITAYVKALS